MIENAPTRPGWRRRLGKLVVFGVVCPLTVLVMLSIFENRLVYFPSGPEAWTELPGLAKEDISLTTAAGVSIHAWWCPHEGSDSALLYCHGNGGNLSMRGEEYRQLQEQLNVSVLAMDYPGYGRSEGRPTEQGCYDAALTAFDWLTKNGTAPDRVILFGESLGGGVVAEVATKRPCRALVLYSTFTSVPEVARGLYPFLPVRLMRNKFNTIRKLPSIHRPIFVAHGDADTLIPVSHARRLFEAAHEPKALYIDSGREHVLELTSGFMTSLRDFLERHAP